MIRIIEQLKTGKYTLLALDSPPPNHWDKKVEIEGTEYETEIVYDLPNHIAVIGSGEFKGKEIIFI